MAEPMSWRYWDTERGNERERRAYERFEAACRATRDRAEEHAGHTFVPSDIVDELEAAARGLVEMVERP